MTGINDPYRLAALEGTGLLDTPPEEEFDRFTKLASKILNCPVAMVSLVDKDRQFFKSSIGLLEPWASKQGTPLSHSFCQHVVAESRPLVVVDATQHPLVQCNLGIASLGIVAYLGVPLKTADGHTLGSFCVIDAKPREWTAHAIDVLTGLAAAVVTEIELRILVKHLHERYLELRSLEIQRDELVQMLVHDLRNPLTSLLGGLTLAEQTPDLNAKHLKRLSIARGGGELLLRMINDILDVNKSETHRLDLELSKVDPASIVEAACDQIHQLAEVKGVKLKRPVAANLPVLVADIDKLRRVLVNLLANAVQHTSAGGEVTISISMSEGTDTVQFAVSDNGCGIHRDAIGQIFEKYGQVKIRRTGTASTGLGLTFCKMTIEAHGGSIWVESEPGQGTVFRFTIPIEADAPIP